MPTAPQNPFMAMTAPRSAGLASWPTNVIEAAMTLICPIEGMISS
jgi:hypothetical protein